MFSQIVLQIVLLRHATRSAALDDSPLNIIGLAQAKDFADFVQRGEKLPPPTRLLVSPKLRARQTLGPLSYATGLELETLDALDERRERESAESFEERVLSIISHLATACGQTQQEAIYLCTHLDVLEAAALLWPTDFSEHEGGLPWSTLEYQVFIFKDGVLEASDRGRIEPRSHDKMD